MTLRKQLLDRAGTPAGSVDLGGGVTVHVRRLMLAECLRVQDLGRDEALGGIRRLAEIVRLVACDESGKALFAAADEVVAGVALPDADRIVDAAMEANGLTKGSAERGKANSGPTPNSG